MSSNWMPYLSHVGNQPATIVVDLGVEEADISRLPYLVRVRVAVRESGDTGFPSHEDSDEVNALDDSLNAALTSDERYVGRVTTHTSCTSTRADRSNVRPLCVKSQAVSKADPSKHVS